MPRTPEKLVFPTDAPDTLRLGDVRVHPHLSGRVRDAQTTYRRMLKAAGGVLRVCSETAELLNEVEAARERYRPEKIGEMYELARKQAGENLSEHRAALREGLDEIRRGLASLTVQDLVTNAILNFPSKVTAAVAWVQLLPVESLKRAATEVIEKGDFEALAAVQRRAESDATVPDSVKGEVTGAIEAMLEPAREAFRRIEQAAINTWASAEYSVDTVAVYPAAPDATRLLHRANGGDVSPMLDPNGRLLVEHRAFIAEANAPKKEPAADLGEDLPINPPHDAGTDSGATIPAAA